MKISVIKAKKMTKTPRKPLLLPMLTKMIKAKPVTRRASQRNDFCLTICEINVKGFILELIVEQPFFKNFYLALAKALGIRIISRNLVKGKFGFFVAQEASRPCPIRK